MRVALDVTPLIGKLTGIGRFVDDLRHAFPVRTEHSERSDANDADRGHPSVELVPFAMTWRGRHAVVDHAPIPAGPMRQIWRRLPFPSIRWWTGPVDVVHATNYVLPPSGRIPGIVSVHDLTTLHHPQWCSEDTRVFPELVRVAVRRGAVIHADSHFVAEEIRSWLGIAEERIAVVPLGVPARTSSLADGTEPVLRSDGNDPALGRLLGRPYVLSVGTIEPRKDLPSLVQAFGQLAAVHPDLLLAVVGQDGWGSDAYNAAVDALSPDTRSRVVRLGYVDDRTRRALLAGAAVFAYPSRYEGFGLPPLEAMVSGVPVVATTAGSLPEILGNAADLVPVGDPDALANAIDRVLADAEHRGELVRRGVERAGSYSTRRCVEGIVDLYASVVHGTERPNAYRGGPG